MPTSPLPHPIRFGLGSTAASLHRHDCRNQAVHCLPPPLLLMLLLPDRPPKHQSRYISYHHKLPRHTLCLDRPLGHRASSTVRGQTPCRLAALAGLLQTCSPATAAATRRWTHYRTLNVPESAAPRDIRASYLAITLETHPDRIPATTGATERARRLAEFHRAKEAYEVLRDAGRRAAYDLQLLGARGGFATGAGAAGAWTWAAATAPGFEAWSSASGVPPSWEAAAAAAAAAGAGTRREWEDDDGFGGGGAGGGAHTVEVDHENEAATTVFGRQVKLLYVWFAVVWGAVGAVVGTGLVWYSVAVDGRPAGETLDGSEPAPVPWYLVPRGPLADAARAAAERRRRAAAGGGGGVDAAMWVEVPPAQAVVGRDPVAGGRTVRRTYPYAVRKRDAGGPADASEGGGGGGRAVPGSSAEAAAATAATTRRAAEAKADAARKPDGGGGEEDGEERVLVVDERITAWMREAQKRSLRTAARVAQQREQPRPR